MGLKERRAVKDFEDNAYPALKQKVFDTLGFEPTIEVKWDTLAVEGYDHMYAECFPKVYFDPLIAGLAGICVDDMGKDAIKGSLKSIVIKNESDNHSPRSWSSFDGGTLTLDHRAESNIDDVKGRAEALQSMLENNL